MEDIENCFICNSEITHDMEVCPNCGTIIYRKLEDINTENRYDYDKKKKLEHLHKIELTLENLEHELEAFLCKKL